MNTDLFLHRYCEQVVNVSRSRHKYSAIEFAHASSAAERYSLLLLLI